MKDEFIICGIIAGISISLIVACLALIGIPALIFDYVACSRKASIAGLEYTWGPIVECNVKFKTKWIPYDKWRAMEQIER